MDGYRMTDTVVAFCLDEPVRSLLLGAAARLHLQVAETGLLTDLIAIPSMLVVANADALGPQLDTLLSWVVALDDDDYRLLLTTKPARIPSALRRNIIDPPAAWDEDYFKFLLLQRRKAVERRDKERRQYDRRVFRLMYILRDLSRKRRVRAADLAQEFNVSLRTVERDIQLLQELGAFIDYDPSARAYTVPAGWVCPYCPSAGPADASEQRR